MNCLRLVVGMSCLLIVGVGSAAPLRRDSPRIVPPASSRDVTGVRVDCASGGYFLSVGKDSFDFDQQDGLFTLSTADGDVAGVSCDLGCVPSEGDGACNPAPASAQAKSATGTRTFRLVRLSRTGDLLQPFIPLATSQVNCPGGTSYDIGTGTGGGTCTIVHDANNNVTGGSCVDGTNTSAADCLSNNGAGSCGNTGGSGTCTKVH